MVTSKRPVTRVSFLLHDAPYLPLTHSVVKPPKDQLEYPRVALISFNHSYKDLPLKPLESEYSGIIARLADAYQTPL